MVWTLIIIILVAADQISKYFVRDLIDKTDSIPVIDGFFYLIYRINKGAAWSFLANKDWGIYVLAAISFVASIVMIYLIIRSRNRRFKTVLSIICAGSIGNLIDRVAFKGVTDFVDLHFWNYNFPTFNVADSLVVCGTILMALFILFDSRFLSDFTDKEKKI
ncbi:MAG: signal peptidase II [Saccharofermentanales bacterium]